jgi:thiol-disulfide isomerase/thioredoxin/uncharacterized membrane protein YphA (DoxX/SURF4 family)
MATLALASQVLLSVVFAVAAVGKFLDLKGSRRAMADFGVPERLAPFVGTVLPVAELTIAVALIPAATARWAALAGLVLLLAFIAGIGAALARGQAPDCHCFGQIHSAPAGPSVLVRNGILAALALLIVVHGAGTPVDDWVSARSAAELVAVLCGIATVALGALSVWLWRESRRWHKAYEYAQEQIDSLPPGLPVGLPAPSFVLPDINGDLQSLDEMRERGLPVMLLFTGPSCGACKAMMPDVGRWQRALQQRLTIAVMTGGTKEENLPHLEEHGVTNVIFQERYEVMAAYRVRATPSAVIVTPDGKVATLPATGTLAIEPLIRLALESDLAPSATMVGERSDD